MTLKGFCWDESFCEPWSERILWMSLHTECKHVTSGPWKCGKYFLGWSRLLDRVNRILPTYMGASSQPSEQELCQSEPSKILVKHICAFRKRASSSRLYWCYPGRERWTVCGGTQRHPESDQTLFRNFLNKKQSSPPPRRFGKLVAASTSYFSTSLIVYSWLQFSGLSCIGTPSGSPGSVSVSSFVSVTSSSSKEGSSWSY